MPKRLLPQLMTLLQHVAAYVHQPIENQPIDNHICNKLLLNIEKKREEKNNSYSMSANNLEIRKNQVFTFLLGSFNVHPSMLRFWLDLPLNIHGLFMTRLDRLKQDGKISRN